MTQVKVKNVLFFPVSLDTGVGEGSVMSPKFFSCGMTDFSVVAKRMKADLKDSNKIDVWVNKMEYADDCIPVMGADSEDRGGSKIILPLPAS